MAGHVGDDDLLDCRGAAVRLGLTVQTVQRLLRQGKLPGRKERERWRVRRRDCDAWLAARRGAFAPAPPTPQAEAVRAAAAADEREDRSSAPEGDGPAPKPAAGGTPGP